MGGRKDHEGTRKEEEDRKRKEGERKEEKGEKEGGGRRKVKNEGGGKSRKSPMSLGSEEGGNDGYRPSPFFSMHIGFLDSSHHADHCGPEFTTSSVLTLNQVAVTS